MSNIESGKSILLLSIGILILVIFCFLVSIIALIRPIRKYAQENKSNREIIAFVLGFVVFLSIFLAITRLETDTSFESPPHGVVSGLWDNFENSQSGALFLDLKTEEETKFDDILLRQISRERFLRYLLPPFLRHYCYTRDYIGCRWADIDVSNFDDKYEWVDFSLRISIGIFSGFMTSVMAWLYTENKNTLQVSTAG